MLDSSVYLTVISEWNNTDEDDTKNRSTTVLATGSPYQNNEGPLQRDEVKTNFNKDEGNDNNVCKCLWL